VGGSTYKARYKELHSSLPQKPQRNEGKSIGNNKQLTASASASTSGVCKLQNMYSSSKAKPECGGQCFVYFLMNFVMQQPKVVIIHKKI
jgi:hypothetical protein